MNERITSADCETRNYRFILQLLASCRRSPVLARDIIRSGIMMPTGSSADNLFTAVASAMLISSKLERSVQNFVSRRMILVRNCVPSDNRPRLSYFARNTHSNFVSKFCFEFSLTLY